MSLKQTLYTTVDYQLSFSVDTELDYWNIHHNVKPARAHKQSHPSTSSYLLTAFLLPQIFQHKSPRKKTSFNKYLTERRHFMGSFVNQSVGKSKYSRRYLRSKDIILHSLREDLLADMVYWKKPTVVNLYFSQLWQWWIQMESFIIIYFDKLYLCWWLTQRNPSQLERVDSAFRRVSLQRKRCNPRCNISSQIVCKGPGLHFTEKQLHCCTPVYHCITVSQRITVQCSIENQSNLWACVQVM